MSQEINFQAAGSDDRAAAALNQNALDDHHIRRPEKTSVFLVLASAVTLWAGPALAQNGYTFTSAGSGAVNYTLAPTTPQHACSSLKGEPFSVEGAQVTIVIAEEVKTDATPAFCRIVGVIEPEVQFEVALPAAWNRRLYMRGNGGFAGEPLEAPMRVLLRNTALRNGFVAAQTNTGHDAAAEPLATFAENNLPKLIDYSFRGVHLTAATAKTLATRCYGRPAAFSYFDGCSTGGRQGLMSAQRYPGDFDGIVVGAPVLNFTDTQLWGVWNAKALTKAPISTAKIKTVLSKAVYDKCDAVDGLKDGLITDPRRCDFDPMRDAPICTGGADQPDCITSAQADALRSVYGGIVSQGRSYFPGQPVGAEAEGSGPPGAPKASGWDEWYVSSGKSRQLAYGEAFLRFLISQPKSDPTYDWTRFDFDKDIPPQTALIRRLLDATDPDLSAFRARGGRILSYFGWADPALNPRMGIDYYGKVSARFGDKDTREFYRLFMVPGMFHCSGGVGPDRFDPLTPLIDWVESGRAPDRIVAEQREGATVTNPGRLVRSRPLCPYPQVARYSGSGSVDQAGDFTCSNPD